MTRALVWKELREQWVVWLALAVAAVAGVASLHALLNPNYRDEMLVAVLWLTAWGYGLVCGSLLLAGETEEGTQFFLDTLPVTRDRLWRTKARIGLLLLAAQAALLVAVKGLLIGNPHLLPGSGGEQAGILFYGLVGYAWGLYSGSRSATVLGAIARGVVAQVVLALALFPFVVLTVQILWGDHTAGMQLLALTLALGLVAALPAVRSRLNYCHTDRLRVPAPGPQRAGPARQSWNEVFRLAAREARWFALGMALFGLLGTAAVTALGAVAWPVASVLIGVFCGVTVFTHGRSGGRHLLAGAAVRFTIALAAAVLTALAPLVLFVAVLELGTREALADLGRQLETGSVAALAAQPILFLFLWLVDGFAVGLVCGLCFRRSIAAGLVAVPCACLLAGPWLPAVLLAEHPAAWQVWGGPAVLLAGAFWLVGARAGDKPSSLYTAGVAACAGLAAAGWTGAALWYRAVEIPSTPGAVDVEAYQASLPDARENEGGRLTAAALRRLHDVASLSGPEPESQLLFRSGHDPRFGQPVTLAALVARDGWVGAKVRMELDRVDPDNVNLLSSFLDRVFKDEWVRDLERAADQPTGILVDPREGDLASADLELADARDAAVLLVARGLQRQHEGDPEPFVDHLRTGLALARTLRHRSVAPSVFVSILVEERMARGVGLWLKWAGDRTDLLRRVQEILREHELTPRPDLEDVRKADFLLALNTTADPDRLLGVRPDPFLPDLSDQVNLRLNLSRFEQGILESGRFDFPFPVPTEPPPPGLHLWSAAPGDGVLTRLALRAPWERIRLSRMLEQAESRGVVKRRATRAVSRLERAAEHEIRIFRFNAWLRERIKTARQRCSDSLSRVAWQLELAELIHPPEKPGGRAANREKDKTED
jgi:hypothetical protein